MLAAIVLILGGALVTIAWAVEDHRRWIALGAGGLPSTWGGWLRMTRWRLIVCGPLETTKIDCLLGSEFDVSLLAGLPIRRGPRPMMAPYPVPQRQLDQHGSEDVKACLAGAFDARVQAAGAKLRYAISHFEQHSLAVTAKITECPLPHVAATKGEIGHIHPSDGSMHMVLSPSDALSVMRQGWGELHGLAGVTMGVPATYMFIYAPRSEAEVSIDGQILDAAISYISSPRAIPPSDWRSSSAPPHQTSSPSNHTQETRRGEKS